MIGVWRVLVDILLDYRLVVQASLVRLQSFVIQPWTVLEWVVHRVLILMCCCLFGCGPCVWRLDSTFRPWVFPPLTCVNRYQDECEVCEGCSVYRGGSCGHLVRLQTCYAGLSCSITVVCDSTVDGFVSVCLDTWPHTEATRTQDLNHSRTWYYAICFEKLEEWVVYRVLTLMCCCVCGCGPYVWRLDSTFREWVFPPLTCVNRYQDECEGYSVYRGGSCGHLVRLQTWYTGIFC